MAQPSNVAALLDGALEREDPVALSDMAKALGVTTPTGNSPIPAPETPSSTMRGRGGRGGRSTRGRGRGGSKSTSGVSDSSLRQASDTIASMMRRDPQPVPTEEDVALRKIDEMSAVSSRIEEELEEERAKRMELEKRLDELSMSHNALATQFVQLSSKWELLLKGNAQKPKEGAVPASTLVGPSGSTDGKGDGDHLPPPSNKPSSSSAARGGVARGRRRGGL